MSNFYSLKAERPGGKVYDFADLKGKTVLIVNVASQWWVFCDAKVYPSWFLIAQWIYFSVQRLKRGIEFIPQNPP